MFGGLNRTLAAAAIIIGAVLAVSPAALADNCSGGPSAQNVYTECLGSGGGGKPTGHSGTGSSSNGSHSTNGGTGGATSAPISQQTKKALVKAGKDGKPLSNLVKGLGASRLLQSSSAPATEPTAVGSAFDLGSGPTALLIVLAGSAILLLGASGYRVVRQRQR